MLRRAMDESRTAIEKDGSAIVQTHTRPGAPTPDTLFRRRRRRGDSGTGKREACTWASCETCDTWRRLPKGTQPPGERDQWCCSQGFVVWDRGKETYYASCDVAAEIWDDAEGSEEEVIRTPPKESLLLRTKRAKRHSTCVRNGGALAAPASFVPGYFSAAMAAAEDDGRSWDTGEVCQLMGCTTQLLACSGHREVGQSLGCAEREHIMCKSCLEEWFEAHKRLRKRCKRHRSRVAAVLSVALICARRPASFVNVPAITVSACARFRARGDCTLMDGIF